ncbi:nuclear protein qri2 [Ophiostoma piceae UAMH 11346]|uniref:Non-structural maintenance of chromosomes element 4 n=1 Tax=Ophiostoma piceae (strain UAMH 11346) TaxID=1262450 RepID=S3BWF7_OPHP1|nr:nuclear protein qri2 [Ophiostoma piceae UAMH 11346]
MARERRSRVGTATATQSRANPVAEAATQRLAHNMPSVDIANDPSLSQAQDVNWNEVADDPEKDAAETANERRRLQRGIRSLIKQTSDEQNKFYDAKSDMVQEVLVESADLLKQARQTTEAAIDAQLVIRVSELAYKRTTHFLTDRANDSTGIDLEHFITKCTDYMRAGRGVSNSNMQLLTKRQRQRRRFEAMSHRRSSGRRRRSNNDGEEEEDDDDDDGGDDDNGAAGADDDVTETANDDEGSRGGTEKLDWTHFGQYACLPRTRRPALARFLPRTSPLSADEKARVVRKRTAALRLHELQEVRPQVLRPGDLHTSANNDVTALATNILEQLRQVVAQSQDKVEAAYYEQVGETNEEDQTEEEKKENEKILAELLERHGLRSDGGVDLIRFAVNPQSFGQTVENFFYISFLVRDGNVGLAYDDNGLPSIYPVNEEDNEAAKDTMREDTRRNQLILSLDMEMWRDMIETFNIRHSMIAHRDQTNKAHPGGRAWFT